MILLCFAIGTDYELALYTHQLCGVSLMIGMEKFKVKGSTEQKSSNEFYGGILADEMVSCENLLYIHCTFVI